MSETFSGFELRFDNVRKAANVGDEIEVVINDEGRTRTGEIVGIAPRYLTLDGGREVRKSSLSVVYESKTGFGFEAREVSLL